MDRKYRDLKSYLPDVYKKVDEMESLVEVEQPLVDEYDENIHKAFNNTFILLADEEGIKKYEQMLNIVPDKYDTLQTRRLRVLTRWGRLTPYTYRALVQKLGQICGEKEFDLFKNFDEYKLKIMVYDVETAIVQAIRRLCVYMIPANMIWWIAQIIRITFYYYEHILMKLNLKFPIYDSVSVPYLKIKLRSRFLNPEQLSGKIHRLDGTWDLDGSVLLDNVPYTLKMYLRDKIPNNEKFSFSINGESV